VHIHTHIYIYIYIYTYTYINADEGLHPDCLGSKTSSVPPEGYGTKIQYSDVDMEQTIYGNMTVVLTVGMDKVSIVSMLISLFGVRVCVSVRARK
jgi:hypothetical protein